VRRGVVHDLLLGVYQSLEGRELLAVPGRLDVRGHALVLQGQGRGAVERLYGVERAPRARGAQPLREEDLGRLAGRELGGRRAVERHREHVELEHVHERLHVVGRPARRDDDLDAEGCGLAQRADGARRQRVRVVEQRAVEVEDHGSRAEF